MHTDFESMKELYPRRLHSKAVLPITKFYIHTELSKSIVEYAFWFFFFFFFASQTNIQASVQTIYESVVLQDKLKKTT